MKAQFYAGTMLRGASCLAGLALLATGSGASGAPAADTQEIVVTAQKREQRIQDVPISISALTGQQIESRGVKNLNDLAGAVPGISFSGQVSGRNTYAIRGISTTTEIPTVELFIDDIPITSRSNEVSGAVDPDILDVQRVEVLKGPQGTLYGGSAMGGAIRFISNRPDMHSFRMSAEAEAAATRLGSPSYGLKGMINIPIVDGKLALRVAGQYRDVGGFVDRVAGGQVLNVNRAAVNPATGRAIGLDANGRPLTVDPATGYATSVPPSTSTSLNTMTEKDINYAHRTSMRASLMWTPDSTLRIIPAVYYQRNTVGDFGYFWGNLPAFQTSGRTPETGRDGMELYSLTVEKDLGGVSFTSISSIRNRDQKFHSDSSFYIGGLVSLFATLPSDTMVDSHFNYFTQELRISSAAHSALKWTGGLFYTKENNDFNFSINTKGASALGIPPLHGVPDVVYSTILKKTLKQYAAFAEVSYSPAERLELTLGGRLFRFDQGIDRLVEGLLSGGGFAFKKTTSETGFSPKATASYKLTPHNMMYASISKGFRAGGANNGLPANLCASGLQQIGLSGSPDEYSSDSLVNYELGSKNTFANGRLTLNAAAFYIDWSRIQQQVFLPSCGFTFTANVGQAASKGGEIEMRASITDNFSIGGAITHTDARITKSVTGTGAQDGDRVLKTPKWTLQANAEFRQRISDRWTFFLRGDYQYRTSQWRVFDRFICRTTPGAVADPQRPACTGAGQVPVANDSQIQPGYGYANASVGFESERWGLTLFVNNLFDSRPDIDHYEYDFVDRRSTLRPRTVGVRFLANLR